MPDPIERFIDAAVAPMDDNAELQLAARERLGSMIEPSQADGPHLTAAAECLEPPGSDRRVRIRRLALIAGTLLLSAYPLVSSVSSLWRSREMALAMGDLESASNAAELYRGLSAEKTRLLMGGKDLWNFDPQNAAYFADYAIRYYGNHDSLPPSFLETARKLAPDNPWFTSYAAGVIGEGSVTRKMQNSAQRKAREPREYTIEDATKMKEALDLLHEAAQQKSFSSPQNELMAQQAKVLPQETDSTSRYALYAYIAGQPAASLKLSTLSNIVSAQATVLEGRKDAAGLKTLMGDWESILAAWLGDTRLSLIEGLVMKSSLATTSRQFAKSAEALGLKEEAARWKQIDDSLEAAKEARDRRSPETQAFSQRLKQHGSMLAGLTLPISSMQSSRRPPVSDDDLLAMRMAEHALMSRVLAIAVWAMLALMMLAAGLYHFRGGMVVRILSRRVEALLLPVDWAWIIGASVVLPIIWQQMVLNLTPLSGFGWSLAGTQFTVPTGAFTSLGWLLIMAPVAVARWRLGLRASFLGLARPRAWAGWLAAACAAMAIPALGGAWLGESPFLAILIFAGILISVAQVIWLITGIRALFSRREQLLRRVAISRAAIPAYAAGMLAMLALIPFFHAQERRWIARDSLMRPAPESNCLTRYEAKVAENLRQELKDLLEPK